MSDEVKAERRWYLDDGSCSDFPAVRCYPESLSWSKNHGRVIDAVEESDCIRDEDRLITESEAREWIEANCPSGLAKFHEIVGGWDKEAIKAASFDKSVESGPLEDSHGSVAVEAPDGIDREDTTAKDIVDCLPKTVINGCTLIDYHAMVKLLQNVRLATDEEDWRDETVAKYEELRNLIEYKRSDLTTHEDAIEEIKRLQNATFQSESDASIGNDEGVAVASQAASAAKAESNIATSDSQQNNDAAEQRYRPMAVGERREVGDQYQWSSGEWEDVPAHYEGTVILPGMSPHRRPIPETIWRDPVGDAGYPYPPGTVVEWIDSFDGGVFGIVRESDIEWHTSDGNVHRVDALGNELCHRVIDYQEDLVSFSGHCPTCNSPDPSRHPAVQFEGEVEICKDAFHDAGQKSERVCHSGLVDGDGPEDKQETCERCRGNGCDPKPDPERLLQPHCMECSCPDIETSGPDLMPIYCRACNSTSVYFPPVLEHRKPKVDKYVVFSTPTMVGDNWVKQKFDDAVGPDVGCQLLHPQFIEFAEHKDPRAFRVHQCGLGLRAAGERWGMIPSVISAVEQQRELDREFLEGRNNDI